MKKEDHMKPAQKRELPHFTMDGLGTLAAPIRAWKVLARDKKLRFGDFRLVETGQTLSVDGPIALCARGIHGSVDVCDAVAIFGGFALPGRQSKLARVELFGNLDIGVNKIAAQHCKFIWIIDINEQILRIYDRWRTTPLGVRVANNEDGDSVCSECGWPWVWPGSQYRCLGCFFANSANRKFVTQLLTPLRPRAKEQ